MKDVATTDGISGHHGDHGLRDSSNEDLKIQHVQPPDSLLCHLIVSDVAIFTSDLLITTRAEGVGALAGEDDDPDRDVISRPAERFGHLEEGLWAKRIASLRSADGDLGDPLGHLIGDVAVVPRLLPRRERQVAEIIDRVVRRSGDHSCGSLISHEEHAIGDALDILSTPRNLGFESVSDLVAIDLPLGEQLVAEVADALSSGDAITILDPRWGSLTRSQAMGALRPTVIVDGSGRTSLPDGQPVDEGDALVVLSSGSVAAPKAAILTLDAVVASPSITRRIGA